MALSTAASALPVRPCSVSTSGQRLDALIELTDGCGDQLAGGLDALREILHRLGDHAKAFASLASTHRFNRSVERDNARLKSDLTNILCGFGNLLQGCADAGNADFHVGNRRGQHSGVAQRGFNRVTRFSRQAFGFQRILMNGLIGVGHRKNFPGEPGEGLRLFFSGKV
jgi:hypothetical protein